MAFEIRLVTKFGDIIDEVQPNLPVRVFRPRGPKIDWLTWHKAELEDQPVVVTQAVFDYDRQLSYDTGHHTFIESNDL